MLIGLAITSSQSIFHDWKVSVFFIKDLLADLEG